MAREKPVPPPQARVDDENKLRRTAPPFLHKVGYAAHMYGLQAMLALPLYLRGWKEHFYPPENGPSIVKTYDVRPALPVRIFFPASFDLTSPQQLPTLFTIHGGGWCIGVSRDDDEWNRAFADAHSALVISLEYAKAPWSPFPTAVHDLEALFHAVLADESLPIARSPSRVALLGFSAGGNLALALAQLPSVSGAAGGAPQAAVSVYGCLDLARSPWAKMHNRFYKVALPPPRNHIEDPLARLCPSFDWSYIPYGHDLRDPLLSPAFAEREGLPRHVCLVGAELDMLAHESWRSAVRWANEVRGGPSRTRPVPDPDIKEDKVRKVGKRASSKRKGELEPPGDDRYDFEEWDEDGAGSVKWLLVPDVLHAFDNPGMRNVMGGEETMQDAEMKTVAYQAEVAGWLYREYQYEPLHGLNHIRLLELLPGSEGDPISVILHEHSLSDDAGYEAISYVWGDPAARKEINCGRGTLQVTVNLHDALSHFRWPDRARMLWSDAACINQQDLDERASQVQLMHLIYQNASRCLVWLGPSDADSAAAVPLIADMTAIVARRLGVDLDQLDEQLERQGRDMFLAKRVGFEGLPEKTDPIWASLMRFFARKWFSRVWVIQEVNFARSVLFYCGADCMSWAALFHVSDWIMTNSGSLRWHDIMTRQPHDLASLMTRRSGNLMDMRRDGFNKDKLEVDQLLDYGKAFDATDLRDKVFAMMNFNAFRRAIPDMVADYTLSVAQVYTETTMAAIRGQKNLRILLTVEHDPDKPESEFPSWVPRWHRPDSNRSISALLSQDNTASADESLPLDQVKVLQPGPVLQLPGLVVDVVQDLCDIHQPLILNTGVFSRHAFRPHKPWARYRYHDPEDPASRPVEGAPYQTKPDIVEAYALVLTGGYREHDNVFAIGCGGHPNLVAANRVEFVAWLSRLRAIEALFPEYVPPGLYSPTQPGFGDLYGDQIPDWSAHWERMIRVYLLGRMLFRTRRGYLGLGTRGLMEGDLVCVLFGGNVPFVLRKVGAGEVVDNGEERYALVGNAYVHGIMEGQVVKEWKEGKRERRIFNLV
ncbi:uncharacterized protein E0L32_000209 [Thyridium curvatum]|uniref:Heterokaryon incompatibility domain-containing protein n=1 Tax=Thyridium curvatum TaxID=1093900 RepID=A0A507AYI6_9PEZI|nr:uncharacterized protein E0L32_000209 [Thyridium curvatum]TPX15875.1 hypothetical protein E0L32_000209 [Thyridium curvatum]